LETLVSTEQAHQPEYITDANGRRKAVVLPIEEYEALIEDLAVVAERRDEPTCSHQAIMEELEHDGILSD
jgi:PHD/YefM family antitoxin component YafN of YafNO toxin-antitoxin module